MVSDSPLISIVVTAYNSDRYLEDCINSILSQSYSKWQIVFVDDCSTDKTIEKMKEIVIKKNIFDKVKLFRHLGNYGYGASLYHSISKSDGEIVGIVDSDDILLEKDALKMMVNAHIIHPKVSLIYSDYSECRDDGVPYKQVKCTTLAPGQTVLGVFKGGKYHGANVIVSHFKTFKKSFYNMTDGVNPKLKKAVDRDITLKLEEVGNLLHLSANLYGHRIQNESISLSFRHKSKEYRDEVMRMKMEMYLTAWNRRHPR